MHWLHYLFQSYRTSSVLKTLKAVLCNSQNLNFKRFLFEVSIQNCAETLNLTIFVHIYFENLKNLYKSILCNKIQN